MRRGGALSLVMAMVSLGLFLPDAVGAQSTPAADDAKQAAERSAASDQSQGDTGARASDQAGLVEFFRRTEVTVTADLYFHYNFTAPLPGGVTALRSFDVRHNSFSLALVEVALNKLPAAGDRVGFRLDLDYGPVASWVHAAEPDGAEVFENLQQGYVSYLIPVGKGLTVDAGKFVTQHGAEVIEAKDNWNYSRSLLFSWAIPFYHSGVRVTYPVNATLTVSGALVNGWNNVLDNNAGKSYGIQAVVAPTPALSIVQNYMVGPEQPDPASPRRHLVDTTLTYRINDRFAVMGNYDYGRDRVAGHPVRWQGLAVYGRLRVRSPFAVASRVEVYDDPDGFTTGQPQRLFAVTATGELGQPEGLTARIEYRVDRSTAPVFARPSGLVRGQHTLSVGLIYVVTTRR